MLTRRSLLKGLLSSLAAAAAGSLTRASEVMPPQIRQPMLRASMWVRGRYAVVANRTAVVRVSVDAMDAARQLPDLRAILSTNCTKDLSCRGERARHARD